MEIFTIGFTKKSAAEFFESLKRAGIKALIDIRLNNLSQLSGYAKKDDLSYFLKEICGSEYLYEPILAPTAELLDKYRKKIISWAEYEEQFLELMRARNPETVLNKNIFNKPTVLLCSELKADKCHRRLVAEYLRSKWGDLTIKHL